MNECTTLQTTSKDVGCIPMMTIILGEDLSILNKQFDFTYGDIIKT